MTLTEFLLARIAEDEAAARAAIPGPWRADEQDVERNSPLGVRQDVAEAAGEEDATHIARHDPARVVAECVAKRRIVQACDYDGMTADYVLATMGEVYADHPDYREEWRP